jgi:hypothetical protein
VQKLVSFGVERVSVVTPIAAPGRYFRNCPWHHDNSSLDQVGRTEMRLMKWSTRRFITVAHETFCLYLPGPRDVGSQLPAVDPSFVPPLQPYLYRHRLSSPKAPLELRSSNLHDMIGPTALCEPRTSQEETIESLSTWERAPNATAIETFAKRHCRHMSPPFILV